MNGEQMGLVFVDGLTPYSAFVPEVARSVRDFDKVSGITRDPPGTRATDPVTSHEAEAKVRPHASTGRRAVLSALALYGPLTDFELAERTGWQQTSIGKRRGECVALGWVEAFTAPSGTKCKRPSPSGSPAIVWAITQAGREAHEEMKGKP